MRKIAGVVAALLVASLVPSSAFAWGAVAHRYITRRAVDLLLTELGCHGKSMQTEMGDRRARLNSASMTSSA